MFFGDLKASMAKKTKKNRLKEELKELGIHAHRLIKAGRYREAEEKYILALKVDPNDVYALGGLGDLRRWAGSYNEALEYYNQALEIDENHSGALFWLVFTHSAQFGRPSAADEFSVRLATIDPLSPLSMFAVGFHHLVSGRLDEALSTFDRILELDPDFISKRSVSRFVFVENFTG